MVEPAFAVPSEDPAPDGDGRRPDGGQEPGTADRDADDAEHPAEEIHVHVGGQGMWVARMASSLGAQVVVCAPLGGETGDLLGYLAQREGLELRGIPTTGSTGAYVHDRRGGERQEIARMWAPPLGRHELDDLYGAALTCALDSDVVVLTGAEPPSVLPAEMLGRLATDLRAHERTVVADLSGDAALAVAEAGLTVLKMSHSEVVEAGIAEGEDLEQLRSGARELLGPVGAVVVSRADDPTLVVTPDGDLLVHAPPVTIVEHRGAGDSLTAGVAVGIGRGLELAEALRLGTAAGALNVTRRGLGSGRPEQIERFAQEVSVEELD